MKLGLFDDPKHVPFSDITYDVVDCKEHRMLNLEAEKNVSVFLRIRIIYFLLIKRSLRQSVLSDLMLITDVLL